MLCRRSFFRWVILWAMIAWLFNSAGIVNLWPVFWIPIVFFIFFRKDLSRLMESWGLVTENAPAVKQKNHEYKPISPINLEANDGLQRRIIRASDGEILVAAEDPETGMLYLED